MVDMEHTSSANFPLPPLSSFAFPGVYTLPIWSQKQQPISTASLGQIGNSSAFEALLSSAESSPRSAATISRTPSPNLSLPTPHSSEPDAKVPSDPIVPNQLTSFPLFGDSGLPLPTPKSASDCSLSQASEDLAAWQPFFSPAVPNFPLPNPHFHPSVLAPPAGVVGFPAYINANGSLLIPDTNSQDPKTTLIPRLNLGALQMQTIGAQPLANHALSNPPPLTGLSQLTPNSASYSGRVSRLTTPSGSAPAPSVMGSSGSAAISRAGTPSPGPSPRAQRVKSAFSSRTDTSPNSSIVEDLPAPSPLSARGKRRRSIFESVSESEDETSTDLLEPGSARKMKKTK